MRSIARALTRPTGLILAPLLQRQGRQLRRAMVPLREPEGPRRGEHPGRHPERPLRLVVLGESTAVGVGVDHTCDSLGPRLAAALSRSSRRAVVWRIHGRAGATAQHLLEHGVGASTGGVDIVVVVLGVNDTLRLTSRSRWRRQLRALLDAIGSAARSTGLIVLVGPPDLRGFAAIPQPLRWTLGRHAAALDYEMSRLAGSCKRTLHLTTPPIDAPRMLAADRFHPNALAYRQWADHIAAAIDLTPCGVGA